VSQSIKDVLEQFSHFFHQVVAICVSVVELNPFSDSSVFNQYLPRDAMLSGVYAVVVCLSVGLSLCHTPVLYQNG